MPWINVGGAQEVKWVNITAKIPSDMMDAIITFQEDAGLGSRSDAIRFLIGAGLDSHLATQAHTVGGIQANAISAALGRMSILLERAVVLFKDPNYDPRSEQ